MSKEIKTTISYRENKNSAPREAVLTTTGYPTNSDFERFVNFELGGVYDWWT